MRITTLLLATSLSSPLAIATEPIRIRVPDPSITEESPREETSRPLRTPILLDEADQPSEPKRLFSGLPLSGLRGKETPAGRKYGRYCENSFLRAGMPNCISRLAKPSTDADHTVGYVGGGTLFGGTQRCSNEGTFGMDYSGHWFSRKTWLKWSHGHRYQGGEGRYQTEGPKLLPE